MKFPKSIRLIGAAACMGLAGLIGCGGDTTTNYDKTDEILSNNANTIANDLEDNGYTIERDVMVVIGDPVTGQPVGMVYNVQATKGNDWQLYRPSSAMYNQLRANRSSFYPPEQHPHLGIYSVTDTPATLQAQIDAFSVLADP